MTLERQSPCKINLLLNVLGKRPDGFHELETVLQPIPLYDQLTFAPAPAGILLTCDSPELPTDSSNLVYRAARDFLDAVKFTGGVRIHLHKNIPLAAGLGGGSSNAATTLLALNELFGHPLAASQLQEMAAALGSDVPFFLQDGPALGTGRGERIVPVAPFPALRNSWVLLVHPGFGVPTPWAYQHLAEFPDALHGTPGRAEALIKVLDAKSIEEAKSYFYNALEYPVFCKYALLGIYQAFLLEHGAVVARMSGSGSTTFALFVERTAAEAAAAKFKANFGSSVWTAIVGI
jgi:4-diphosphocytidyl-2-C-methyl-D-erythritol kinase